MSNIAPVPHDVAAALSRLNEHARAHGCGRDAIYAYKALAALLAAVAGQTNVRPVAMMAKCLSCDGTGKFIDRHDGPTNDPCRKCSRSGYVHLRFVETTIQGQAWHHPWERSGAEIFSAANGWATIRYLHVTREMEIEREGCEAQRIGFGSLGDWKPNQPGEKLKGEAAAALLNVVEDWVLGMRISTPRLHWPLETAQRATRGYQLEIGRIGTACHYCGSTDVSIGQGHWGTLLHFSLPVCAAHERMSTERQDKMIPWAALTPEVRRWLVRRGWTIGLRNDAMAEGAT